MSAAAAVPVLPRAAAPPELRAAQHDAQVKTKASLAAAALAATAAERVEQAKAAQRRIADLAERAVRIGADKLRSRDLSPLPDDLIAARRTAFDCDQDHADAAAVLVLLEAEAAEAQAVADAATVVLARAVDQVVQRKAVELVSHLRELEIEAGQMRGLITSLSMARGSGDQPLAWVIQQIAFDPQHPHLVDAAGPNWSQATKVWNSFRASLMIDAAAPFPA